MSDAFTITHTHRNGDTINGTIFVARTGKRYGFDYCAKAAGDETDHVFLYTGQTMRRMVPASHLRDARHAVRQHFAEAAPASLASAEQQATPVQQQQANAGAIGDVRPDDLAMVPGSASAYPAAAYAFRRAYNGRRNFMTPHLVGYQVTGLWAVEVSRGEGFRNRDGSAGPDLYAVTVVSLDTFEPVNDLSSVVSNREAASLYIGRLSKLACYRRTRRSLLRRLVWPLNSPRERAFLRAQLVDLRAAYCDTIERFGAEIPDDKARRREPGEISIGEAVHAPDMRTRAEPDYSGCTQATPVQPQQGQAFNPTPDVSSRRGAPMGRLSAELECLELSSQLYLVRVRINGGGYDAGGAYWGIGAPLYCVGDDAGNTVYFRAPDRNAAKVIVRADAPSARFHR